MFRKAWNSSFRKTASFYIPFCPRYFDKYNHKEFVSKLVDYKPKNLTDDDRYYIADKVIELSEYEGFKINEPIKRAFVEYSKEAHHDLLGLLVRNVTVASLLQFTSSYDDGVGAAAPLSIMYFIGTMWVRLFDTPYVTTIDQTIKIIDNIIHNRISADTSVRIRNIESKEADELRRKSEMRDYLIERLKQ
jgi:hypothetical protein